MFLNTRSDTLWSILKINKPMFKPTDVLLPAALEGLENAMSESLRLSAALQQTSRYVVLKERIIGGTISYENEVLT
jgi:hypothetical protein